MADKLEADGFLRRLHDPPDRRGVLAEPTAAGVLAYKQAVELLAAEEARFTAELSTELRAHLLALSNASE